MWLYFQVTPITRTDVRIEWDSLAKTSFNGDSSTGGYIVEYREITDFPSPLQSYPQVELKGAIDFIEDRTVHFVDGTFVSDIDILFFGTGFAPPDFPFFDELSVARAGGCLPAAYPNERFLRIFDPHFEDAIGYVGIGIRPIIGR